MGTANVDAFASCIEVIEEVLTNLGNVFIQNLRYEIISNPSGVMENDPHSDITPSSDGLANPPFPVFCV